MTPPLTIAEMNLCPAAKAAAEILRAECPFVLFTSGRRDWWGQARTMAYNETKDRGFIAATYTGSPHPALMAWVKANDPKDFPTFDDYVAGVHAQLIAMPLSEQLPFAHPAGRAFDVSPRFSSEFDDETKSYQALTPEQDALLRATILRLPKLQVFKTKEGNLVIYHAQFIEDAGSVQV